MSCGISDIAWQPMRFIAYPSTSIGATLTAAGDFAYSRARLGLDDADELLVSSSFDYARQAMLYVPRDPPPVNDGFSAAAATEVRAQVRTQVQAAIARKGRSMVPLAVRRAVKSEVISVGGNGLRMSRASV